MNLVANAVRTYARDGFYLRRARRGWYWAWLRDDETIVGGKAFPTRWMALLWMRGNKQRWERLINDRRNYKIYRDSPCP
jgi:hypothetical protein